MTVPDRSYLLEPLELLIFDVDGTLTDGVVSVNDQGIETRQFHITDGLAFKLAQIAGLKIAVVSARRSEALQYRFSGLPANLVRQGVSDKGKAVRDIAEACCIPMEHVAFVGDDLNDIIAFREVGVKIAVANAARLVKKEADWITQASGGFGAAREVIEHVLEIQGKLEASINAYLEDLGG